MTTCYVDVCLGEMAFWYPEVKLGYQCCVPPGFLVPIFYWEAVDVACAMICLLTPRFSRLVVYTDNLNMVDIWHTLKVSAPYNATLILTIEWLITHKIDAHVLHIPGVDNSVVGALSHFNNTLALRLIPRIKLRLFKPPCVLLGAVKK